MAEANPHTKNTNKDYRQWHTVKTSINNDLSDGTLYFYEREIWWTSVGQNVGFETDGKDERFVRPVLILRKFNKFTFMGVPLSTTAKRGYYHYPFRYKPDIESVALLSQARTYDSKRLAEKDGVASEQDYHSIQQKLIEIIRKKPRK